MTSPSSRGAIRCGLEWNIGLRASELAVCRVGGAGYWCVRTRNQVAAGTFLGFLFLFRPGLRVYHMGIVGDAGHGFMWVGGLTFLLVME